MSFANRCGLVKSKLLAIFTVLALCSLNGCLMSAEPSYADWTHKVGEPLPSRYYSVGEHLLDKGVPSGPYGPGPIVLVNPLDASWQNFGYLPRVARRESVAAFHLIDARFGANAWTERDGGAECYTAWGDQGWKWAHTQSFDGWPWALAGPSMAGQEWIALNEGRPNRTNGGQVYKWDAHGGGCWEPITPLIPGVIIWDALPWENGILLGCSLGHGQYHSEWAGRLAFVQDDEITYLKIPPMAGVLRVYHFPAWPGRVWISTTWGEVYYSDAEALDDWTLYHRADYGSNAFLFYLDCLVTAGAKGKLWVGGALVASLPGIEFMSLSPVKLTDGWRLAGVLTETGAKKSRPVVFQAPKL